MINRVQESEDQATSTSLWPNDTDEESPMYEQLRLPEIQTFAKQHPAAVMAIGLVAGLTFGWWVKRK